MGDKKEEQWYSNKDLYEMIRGLCEELTITREAVKAYNDIRKQLNDVCKAVLIIQSEGGGKNKLVSGIILVIGFIGTIFGIVGVITLLADKL